ncbi:MAG: DNA primase [Cyanobacteria bacterium HKST-UBA04]|nr:DNA primase [Cyanobacteria bacterium HKST-UBA04]
MTPMQRLPFQEAALLVKQSLDIVDVVGQTVMLKKAGRNYKGLCPFHNDKKPSFNVNPAKQIYKCFSCGEGGDALAFIMKTQRKTYGEVIMELAAEQGIEVADKRHDPQKKALLDQLYDVHRYAQTFYAQQAQQHDEAQAYFRRRHIPPEWQQRFGLGFAPPGWDNLIKHIHQHYTQGDGGLQHPDDVLEKAALANRRDADNPHGGGIYDRFRHRLMIPIVDERNRVIAFGGRSMGDDNPPKYLNSAESPIYHKSRVLYGINLAAEAIRQTGTVVLMEGYFDVISAHMAGLTQAVGVCGTALTMDHLKLLNRLGAQTLYLCFDGDQAGQQAILRAIEQIESVVWDQGFKLKVITLPKGCDPDDFFQAKLAATPEDTPLPVPENALALLDADRAQDFMAFKLTLYLDEVPDRHTPQGRIDAVRRITPTLARIAQPVAQQEYLAWCAQKIGVDSETLKLELKRYKRNNLGNSGPSEAISPMQERYLNRPYTSTRSGSVSPYRSRFDEVSRLRAQLAVTSEADALIKKEDELMSWLLMNKESFMTVAGAICLNKVGLLSDKAASLFRAIQALCPALADAETDTQVHAALGALDLDGLVDRLQTYFHQHDESPMIAYLAGRLMQLDTLAHQHGLWSDEPSQQPDGSVANHLQNTHHRVKLMRTIGDIVERIASDQQRQHCLSLVSQSKAQQSGMTPGNPAQAGDDGLDVQLMLREALCQKQARGKTPIQTLNRSPQTQHALPPSAEINHPTGDGEAQHPQQA